MKQTVPLQDRFLVPEFSGASNWAKKALTPIITAKWFGNTAGLKALKEGEEHGVKDYERALEDKDRPAAGQQGAEQQ